MTAAAPAYPWRHYDGALRAAVHSQGDWGAEQDLLAAEIRYEPREVREREAAAALARDLGYDDGAACRDCGTPGPRECAWCRDLRRLREVQATRESRRRDARTARLTAAAGAAVTAAAGTLLGLALTVWAAAAGFGSGALGGLGALAPAAVIAVLAGGVCALLAGSLEILRGRR